MIKGIFTDFLVAPLGIGVSNSNGGKNKADALVQIKSSRKVRNPCAIFSFHAARLIFNHFSSDNDGN